MARRPVPVGRPTNLAAAPIVVAAEPRLTPDFDTEFLDVFTAGNVFRVGGPSGRRADADGTRRQRRGRGPQLARAGRGVRPRCRSHDRLLTGSGVEDRNGGPAVIAAPQEPA